MSVRVKICGVTTAPDAEAIAAAGAWAIGFNFFPGSRRYIDPRDAAEIARTLPPQIERVGVFVNAPRPQISEILALVGLTLLQFHGAESPEDCQGWSVPTIKALAVKDASASRDAERYATDYILADAFVQGEWGGTGKTVAHELLAGFDRSRLILAGGLDPDNVAHAIEHVQPFAVDVASGVESAPGHKDSSKVRRFIANAHAA